MQQLQDESVPNYIRPNKYGEPRIGGFLYVIGVMLVLDVLYAFAIIPALLIFVPPSRVPYFLIFLIIRIIVFVIYVICTLFFFSKHKKFKIFFIITMLSEFIFSFVLEVLTATIPTSAFTFSLKSSIILMLFIMVPAGLLIRYAIKSQRVHFTFVRQSIRRKSEKVDYHYHPQKQISP
jgi:hypothetical protein